MYTKSYGIEHTRIYPSGDIFDSESNVILQLLQLITIQAFYSQARRILLYKIPLLLVGYYLTLFEKRNLCKNFYFWFKRQSHQKDDNSTNSLTMFINNYADINSIADDDKSRTVHIKK